MLRERNRQRDRDIERQIQRETERDSMKELKGCTVTHLYAERESETERKTER